MAKKFFALLSLLVTSTAVALPWLETDEHMDVEDQDACNLKLAIAM